MKSFMNFLWSPRVALAALMGAVLVLPGVAQADVERIREKAVELRQSLNKEAFEVEARVETPGSQRTYKNFDFLLKKSKVDELAEEGAGDPRAEQLRLFLIESIVNLEVATYLDDLHSFEQTSTVELDGVELRFADVMKLLANSGEASERRKIYSALSSVFETSVVFRTEILSRRNETYGNWGFDHFANFYSARQGMDLAQTAAAAGAFLEHTQTLYDSLFTVMAGRYLQTEPRKVRFYDLPYLTQGSFFENALPGSAGLRRLKDVFRGLGVDVGDQSNLGLDSQARTGKLMATGVYPVLVPQDVRVSLTPVTSVRDDNELAYAVGKAELFALSSQTDFEPAYMVNQGAQAALAYLPLFVLDEPEWIKSVWEGDESELALYLEYRAFITLFEARVLAARTQFEILAYGGEENLEREFKAVMQTATGARIGAADSRRALEYLSELQSAGRFQGLLMASSLREHFRQTHGDDWYRDGKTGGVLKGLWKQGGTLGLTEISAACGNVQAADAPFVRNIENMLARAGASN